MPKGQRRGNLAGLEQRLTRLDGERRAIIAAIKAAVDYLTHGSPAPAGRVPAAAAAEPVRAARVRRRKVSAEVRERLSKLARERWAKAKKAGKTRLG